MSEQAYYVLKGSGQAKYFGIAEEAARIRTENFLRYNTRVKTKLVHFVTEMGVAKYDFRTSKLFKLEFQADGEIALTAKTNFILGVKDNETCNKKETC